MRKLLCMFLALALVVQFLPPYVFSSSVLDEVQLEDNVITEFTTPDEEYSSAEIVEEDVSKRGEYYKEYVLNNGLRLATIYPTAVHYQDSGEWKEIDNTLKVSVKDGIHTYTNTAGVWDVHFPQQLSNSNTISITKDGCTVSFGMDGEMRSNGGLVVTAVGTRLDTSDIAVSSAKNSVAQIQAIDLASAKAAAEYEEIVPEKNHSKLSYATVYDNTNVVYDLIGNQLKESIILQTYDAALLGYRYQLNTGSLVPVLNDDQSVDLCDPATNVVVMTMPAPFMVDDNGEHCYDVRVTLAQKNGVYILSYYLPTDWLATKARAWPVILDPIIEAECNVLNIQDVTVTETAVESYTAPTIKCGYSSSSGVFRTFLRYKELPKLSSSDVIVSATVVLTKPYDSTLSAPIEVHKVNMPWDSTTVTCSNWSNYNNIVEDVVIVKNPVAYQWDVTNIVQGWYADAANALSNNTGMMFKASDSVENGGVHNWQQFYSSDIAAPNPYLTITFRNNNGLESYWDYTVSSAGRAGTGYVNNYTGNLVWIHNDIGFGGNLLPVSISHVYNANDAANNEFRLGNGWRTNFHQKVYRWDADSNYFVWEDADGTKHYFYNTGTNTYQDEDGLDLKLEADSANTIACKIVDKHGNASYFDSQGRLYKQENNQKENSSIDIVYDSVTSNQISTITDGAGRVYSFSYSAGILRRISYLGTGETEISYVTYEYDSYTGPNLVSIKNADGKGGTYTYDANSMLTKATDVDGYELNYAYSFSGTDKPARVVQISEKSGETEGGAITIEYAHNQTLFTDHNGNTQIKQFNNWGNTISVQDNHGRAQFASYASFDEADDGKGNQLTAASKLQNTVGNLLQDSSFENGTTWNGVNGVSQLITTDERYLGNQSLKFTNHLDTFLSGISKGTFTAKAGESYTFSAYAKTDTNANVYLAISGNGFSIASETLPSNSDWTRLEVTYTNNTDTDTAFSIKVLSATYGTAYVDGAQLEKTETASRYNIIENGDFRYGSNNWTTSQYCNTDEVPIAFAAFDSAAPQLEDTAFQMVGDPEHELRLEQNVPASGQAGDSFVLAGWAKGDSAPLPTKAHKDDLIESGGNIRTFTLRGTFVYTNGETKEFDFDFNPDADSDVNWQYVAGVMVAEEDYSSIKVQLLYDYNANTVLFDGIQLYKEEFGSSYTYDENGNVTSVTDLQGKVTDYEYMENNVDLWKIIQDNAAKVTYTYDAYHNVQSTTSSTGIVYEFTYDDYGNNTEVKIVNGDQVVKTSATYSTDGNRLLSTKDALDNTTIYSYNEDTNILEAVQYPEDSASTRTVYTYDNIYRLLRAQTNLETGTNLKAVYTYNAYDQLESLRTGNYTTYTFNYGPFSLLTSINIGSNLLATYTYTDDQNHYLDTLTYSNGDSIKYTYDGQGRMVQETYEDGSTISYRYDNSGNLATVTDSVTGTKTTYYYDLTDRMVKYTEKNGTNSFTVEYTYDTENNLSARKETLNGTTRTFQYIYDDDNRVTAVTDGASKQTYSYDGWGRLLGEGMLYNDATTLTKTYAYKTLSDAATTGQIHSVTYDGAQFDRTYTYGYDKNGNIVSISDGTTTTTYAYDSANQLLRENNETAGKTWVWAYDSSGNILSRTEYDYTTGDVGTALDTVAYGYYTGTWRDKLISFDGNEITHDTVGNPYRDGVWHYTWEHGRQLKSMTSMADSSVYWNYTYDANGMRVSRTNGTDTYTYVYNGGQLVSMTKNADSLYFSYDASGVMSVNYNGTVYQHITNIQGDIVAILSTSGEVVVEYTYDAWGNILSITGSMKDTLGILNPLCYRGYVYDHETGLYYLQSRYYNPNMGRFINADRVMAGANGSVMGRNLYAYCSNNPVNMLDTTGCWPKWIEKACKNAADWVKEKMVNPLVGFGTDVYADIENADMDNESEDAVFSSNYFSWYKGAIVIKIPLDTSFSFGFIGLSENQQNSTTLNHEYGHIVQLKRKGVADFLTNVAIPSVTANILQRMGNLPYDYYGSPWESEADSLGNVNRTSHNTPWPEDACDSIWDLIELFFD